jgi:hypothetical protein
VYFYFSYYIYIILLLLIDNFIKKDFFILIAVLTIILVSGTRFETGYDFLNYVGFYVAGADETHEPLFTILLLFLNVFTENSQILFFISSSITIAILYYSIIKYTIYKKTTLLIFLLIPGLYLNTFSIIRQGIAEVFLFLAIYYLVYERKSLKFWLFSLVAIGFHYTAMLPIIILWVFKKILWINYSLKTYIFILLFSLILSKLNIASMILGLAFGKFALYLDMTQDVSLFKLLISNLFLIILLIFRKEYIQSSSELFIFNLLFIGILFLNIFASFTPVTRLGYYFLIFQIILVPKLIYSFESNHLKAIFLSSFIAYYSLMFTNSLIIDEQIDQYPKMTPYQNYFFKD